MVVSMAGSIMGITLAAMVLIITLAKTVRQVQQAYILRLNTNLSTVMLRDGKSPS